MPLSTVFVFVLPIGVLAGFRLQVFFLLFLVFPVFGDERIISDPLWWSGFFIQAHRYYAPGDHIEFI